MDGRCGGRASWIGDIVACATTPTKIAGSNAIHLYTSILDIW